MTSLRLGIFMLSSDVGDARLPCRQVLRINCKIMILRWWPRSDLDFGLILTGVHEADSMTCSTQKNQSLDPLETCHA